MGDFTANNHTFSIELTNVNVPFIQSETFGSCEYAVWHVTYRQAFRRLHKHNRVSPFEPPSSRLTVALLVELTHLDQSPASLK